MAVKLKVSDVAKDFALSGKEIAELLEPYCGELKKSSNSLNEDELDIIFELLNYFVLLLLTQTQGSCFSLVWAAKTTVWMVLKNT